MCPGAGSDLQPGRSPGGALGSAPMGNDTNTQTAEPGEASRAGAGRDVRSGALGGRGQHSGTQAGCTSLDEWCPRTCPRHVPPAWAPRPHVPSRDLPSIPKFRVKQAQTQTATRTEAPSAGLRRASLRHGSGSRTAAHGHMFVCASPLCSVPTGHSAIRPSGQSSRVRETQPGCLWSRPAGRFKFTGSRPAPQLCVFRVLDGPCDPVFGLEIMATVEYVPLFLRQMFQIHCRLHAIESSTHCVDDAGDVRLCSEMRPRVLWPL